MWGAVRERIAAVAWVRRVRCWTRNNLAAPLGAALPSNRSGGLAGSIRSGILCYCCDYCWPRGANVDHVGARKGPFPLGCESRNIRPRLAVKVGTGTNPHIQALPHRRAYWGMVESPVRCRGDAQPQQTPRGCASGLAGVRGSPEAVPSRGRPRLLRGGRGTAHQGDTIGLGNPPGPGALQRGGARLMRGTAPACPRASLSFPVDRPGILARASRRDEGRGGLGAHGRGIASRRRNHFRE